MRVRPFFWIILLLACGGVLAFAATYSPSAPAMLQVHIASSPGPTAMTIINLHATDLEGVPLDGVQLLPQANMTNMSMTTQQIYTTPQGQGNYLLRLRLYMAGPWSVTIAMQAQGFAPLKRTIYVQVQATSSGYTQENISLGMNIIHTHPAPPGYPSRVSWGLGECMIFRPVQNVV